MRSLLAGCISCLRWSSALTCRSSPLCVPPRSSRLLSVRGASFFSLLSRYHDQHNHRVPSAAQQQRRCAFQGIFCVHIGAGSSAASPLFSAPRRRAYLSLRRSEQGIRLRTRKQPPRPVHAWKPAPCCCQNFTCTPPLGAAVEALDGK